MSGKGGKGGKAAVLTVSDTCFIGQSEDKSGPVLVKCLRSEGFDIFEHKVVADVRTDIEQTLINWCDSTQVDLIISTGGTGFTPRDVTPEATCAVIDKEAVGIAYALIDQSLKVTPMAMLSRLRAGIRKSTLIINFPGSAKACAECFQIIAPVLQHAIDQLRNNRIHISLTHKQIQRQLKSKVVLRGVGFRDRKSQFDLISMTEAIDRVIKEIQPINDIQFIPIEDLDQLNARLLAKDVSSEIALPPFPASIKDGYAVITADGCGDRKVMSRAATAGQSDKSTQLAPGFCIRISTGAPVPNGADAVVQVEDTSVVELTKTGEESVIRIEKAPEVGQDIRPVGCDIKLDGKPILNRSTELGAIELGLLASIGVHSVPVLRRPVVAVLSTGDEIIGTGGQLSYGQVWDSNRTTLLSLLKQSCVQTIDLGIAVDDVNDIYTRMERGLQSADVLITTGGVSMGEKDLLKQIMETDFSARIHFGRVNLKPGKPTTFATCALNGNKKYIFGLPGNPISAFVTFYLFVKPLLICLSGKAFTTRVVDMSTYQRTMSVKLTCAPEGYKLDERPEFARAVITYHSNDIPTAILTGNQRSSRLLSAKDANALVLLPAKSDSINMIRNGDIVSAFLI